MIEIYLPPLRERREDIPLLAKHFVARIAREQNIPEKTITREAMTALVNYNWQGNIRELQNAVERAFIFSGAEEIDGRKSAAENSCAFAKRFQMRDAEGFRPTLEEMERRYIMEVLNSVDEDKTEAAKFSASIYRRFTAS